jgi:lia operon protein LiaG
MKKILILVLIITGAYIAFNQSSVNAWWSFGEKSTETRVTNRIDLIEIDVSGASTTIIPDNDNTVRAELEGKGNVMVKKSGDSIKVELKKKWLEGFAFFSQSKLTIYIPEDYDQDFSIEVGSGNLNFSGPSQNNPMELEKLSLDIGSGNVQLNNLVAKTFEHDGSSGNVQIDGLTTEKGSFDISSGNVNLRHYSGKLEADVSSGNLEVEIDELKGDIGIDISSGRAKLDLPKDADFTLNGEVTSGHVQSEFPLDTEEKNSIQGKNGTGKYNIDLDVSSGNIVIH